MNCPNCGTSNLDNASVCVNCGRSLSAPPAAQSYTPPPPPSNYGGAPAPAPGTQIPNYLVQSILVTLCCCLPLGIVAIVFAAQVNTKIAQGDLAGARDASQKAKMFCWIALGLGLVVMAIYGVFSGAAIMQAVREAARNR